MKSLAILSSGSNQVMVLSTWKLYMSKTPRRNNQIEHSWIGMHIEV
jgi:hypothetical protein